MAFYNSSRWLKVRTKIINDYHGLDFYQLMVNKKIMYADTVHHIHKLKEYPDQEYDFN